MIYPKSISQGLNTIEKMSTYLAEFALTTSIRWIFPRTQFNTFPQDTSKDMGENCLLQRIRVVRHWETVFDTELGVRADEGRKTLNDELALFWVLVSRL